MDFGGIVVPGVLIPVLVDCTALVKEKEEKPGEVAIEVTWGGTVEGTLEVAVEVTGGGTVEGTPEVAVEITGGGTVEETAEVAAEVTVEVAPGIAVGAGADVVAED